MRQWYKSERFVLLQRSPLLIIGRLLYLTFIPNRSLFGMTLLIVTPRLLCTILSDLRFYLLLSITPPDLSLLRV
jgi:hypothetical protein